MSESNSWDKVMNLALSMPMVKVDRTAFLTKEFSMYDNADQLRDKRPIDLFDAEAIERAARGVINSHLATATVTSTAAGIPGGLAMAATMPADIAQYYWHVLVVAQKLGYLYGWPDLLDDKGQITEGTRNVLTLFVGVMFGAQAASKLVGEIAKRVSLQAAKRLPQQALTKTMYYPVVKQVAKWIGVKMTKDTFGRGVGKAIPILGGVLSGAITAFSFKPMAEKLQKHLREEMPMMRSLNENVFFDENNIEDVAFEEQDLQETPENLEKIKIQACINIAKIDFDFSQEEKDFITEMIDNSDELRNREKKELLEQLNDEKLVDIDFNRLRGNILYATALLESLIAVVKVDNIVRPTEKIYLFKIAHDLGFDKETIKEMLEESK
ncbi:MAG: TerB family tellurite resistance protein [Tannerella sp.]|nr:MAG: TerB family tellurite resistance protein [Tannerella sp.]